MKIFQDWKAQKRFNGTYEKLSEQKQELFAECIRTLAEKKVNSEEGEYNEFYITEKDVKVIHKSVV